MNEDGSGDPLQWGASGGNLDGAMSPDLSNVVERVTRLRARSLAAAGSDALRVELEDALAEGYALALAGDAWSMRTEQRLHELLSELAPGVGPELRDLATEHARFQREHVALRRELAELSRDRDRLRSSSPAPPA